MTEIITKWHSVQDKLPENSDRKIVLCIDDEEDEFCGMAEYNKNWDYFDSRFDEYNLRVTHWCDFPIIPDKQEFAPKNDVIPFEWDVIYTANNGEDVTFRAKVFGGWIINHMVMDTQCESSVFIPDPRHEWRIK